MISLLAFFCLQSHATVSISPEHLLESPIETRVREFKAQGDQGVRSLRAIAFDKKQPLRLRWRALTTMGRWDAIHFRDDLDRALASPDWFMRNAALIALKNDERTRAVAWSMKLLSDPALVIRTQAVRNLIDLSAIEAEPDLWKEIHNRRNFRGEQSLWVRSHIAEALSRFARPGQTRQFQKLLLDNDPRLHKWAILGLETSTGMKLTTKSEPLDIRRHKWLARLDLGT